MRHAARLALLAGVGLVLLGATWAIRKAVQSLDEPLRVSAPWRFKIAPGARFAQVAASLASRGIVPHPRAWVLYARWRGLAGSIKAGEYDIEPGLTPRGLLAKIVSGQVVLHALTIVDGWRVGDLLQAMRRNPDITITVPAVTPDVMARLGAPGVDAEGQFLPETYLFPSGTSDLDVLRQAHAALVRVLDAAWRGRDTTLPLHDAMQLLIMASIVEKESGLPGELPKIAGLYWHRLALGMRLQADPTVIYGLGDAYDGTLHSVDLRTDTPYNTYTRSGLPPTPIALASAAAIDASAHPEKTDALYFVASPKGDGSHVFSATLEKHNLAVAAYVAKQRQKAEAESSR